MNAQTIEMGAGRGTGSKWWVAAAVAVALVVALLFLGAAIAGDSGGTIAPSRGGSTTSQVGEDHQPVIQVGGGPAAHKPLP